MAIQTTYGFTNDPLQKGMIKDGAERCITAYSDAAIAFGVGLAYGGAVGNENRPQLNLPAATGFEFMGVSVYTHKQNTGGDDGFGVLVSTENAEYAIGDDITVLRKGRIVVYAESAVDLDDPVFLRHTTSGALVPGNFRIDADTANADAVAGAKWVTKTAGAGLAVLEINLP